MTTQCTFQEPKDLKEILELLAQLNVTDVFKRKVAEKLLDDVQEYCNGPLDSFYQPSDTSSSGFLLDVFKNAQLIRGEIIESSQQSQYGNYNNGYIHAYHESCIKQYAEVLKKLLPKSYSALFFMYFMGSNTDHSGIGGGGWSDQRCDSTGGFKNVFYNWLTDDSTVKMEDLVTRGFSTRDLSSHNAQEVATAIAKILKHDSPGPLQKVLLYLLFSCEWDNSLLGHACVFLVKFCDGVMEDREGTKFKEYSGDLKTVCQELKSHLQPFIDGSVTYIQAVCKSNSDLYSQRWNPKAIPLYVAWLKDNLDSIIKSLNLMSSECKKWNQNIIRGAQTPGPFRFGFVFKGPWNNSTFSSEVPTLISKLTGSDPGSLVKLKECLGDFSSGSSAAAAAAGAAGGILSLGGAGAGAAYATNAFSLRDIITSLLSSFLK
ncbi:secreted antigen 3 [Babesia divergens]|uniref:Secreted antigen 3 n=1 Tax=Babesia divergens TaxID=32595 RepID=A0AAD9GBM2_BABDI|nr:secreted antigen 3 [Babesia divergens]